MDEDLAKGITFQIDENKRLGTMRIDWADGRLCNQWNPTKLLMELKTDEKSCLKKLQQELNFIQFELLSSFEWVKKYCGGTGYENEQVFSIPMTYNYAIRLIPSKDAYSYIYTYSKEKY